MSACVCVWHIDLVHGLHRLVERNEFCTAPKHGDES